MPREKGKWNRFHHIDESEVKQCVHRANTNPLPEGKGFVNIAGLEFADGNIKVICRYPENSKDRKAQWVCKCNLCGTYFVTIGKQLRTGKVQSCGCLVSKKCAERNTTHGIINELYGDRLHHVHFDMIRRCYNPDRAGYEHYGARGIYIDPEWYTPGVVGNPGLVNFYNWMMEHGYHPGLSIDRIDNDGPYAPWNCRLTDRFVQSNNRSNARGICDGEEVLTYAQFCHKYKVDNHYIRNRLDKGYTLDMIVWLAQHPGDHLKYDRSTDTYYNKDGFIVLIDIVNPVFESKEEENKWLRENMTSQVYRS